MRSQTIVHWAVIDALFLSRDTKLLFILCKAVQKATKVNSKFSVIYHCQIFGTSPSQKQTTNASNSHKNEQEAFILTPSQINRPTCHHRCVDRQQKGTSCYISNKRRHPELRSTNPKVPRSIQLQFSAGSLRDQSVGCTNNCSAQQKATLSSPRSAVVCFRRAPCSDVNIAEFTESTGK